MEQREKGKGRYCWGLLYIGSSLREKRFSQRDGRCHPALTAGVWSLHINGTTHSCVWRVRGLVLALDGAVTSLESAERANEQAQRVAAERARQVQDLLRRLTEAENEAKIAKECQSWCLP